MVKTLSGYSLPLCEFLTPNDMLNRKISAAVHSPICEVISPRFSQDNARKMALIGIATKAPAVERLSPVFIQKTLVSLCGLDEFYNRDIIALAIYDRITVASEVPASAFAEMISKLAGRGKDEDIIDVFSAYISSLEEDASAEEYAIIAGIDKYITTRINSELDAFDGATPTFTRIESALNQLCVFSDAHKKVLAYILTDLAQSSVIGKPENLSAEIINDAATGDEIIAKRIEAIRAATKHPQSTPATDLVAVKAVLVQACSFITSLGVETFACAKISDQFRATIEKGCLNYGEILKSLCAAYESGAFNNVKPQTETPVAMAPHSQRTTLIDATSLTSIYAAVQSASITHPLFNQLPAEGADLLQPPTEGEGDGEVSEAVAPEENAAPVETPQDTTAGVESSQS